MKHAISHFASVLRSSGVPVSTAEVLDCMSAIAWIDTFDRSIFKTVLQAHLIKSQRYVEKFDHCFSLVFDQNDVDQAITEEENSEQKQELPASKLTQEFIQKSLEQNPDSSRSEELSSEVLRFLQNGDGEILDSIEQMQRGEGLGSGGGGNQRMSGLMALGQNLEIMSAINQVRKDFRTFFDQQLNSSPDDDLKQILHRQKSGINQRLDCLTELTLNPKSQENLNPRVYKAQPLASHNVGEKSLTALDPEEQEKLFSLMKDLIRKVNSAASLRFRKNKRGRINIKKTFRESMRFGGVPVKLHYQSKIKRKGDIIALCDVSGSVYSYSRIMLTLLYAMASQYKQIKSFAFISDLVDITTCMESDHLEEALEQTLNDSILKNGASSDYGEAFRQFDENYISLIGPRTTVILIGDARNNGNLTEHKILEKIYKRAKRVIWLNPESHRFWTQGDSEFSSYLPYCTEFRECRTFNQLEDFVIQLTG